MQGGVQGGVATQGVPGQDRDGIHLPEATNRCPSLITLPARPSAYSACCGPGWEYGWYNCQFWPLRMLRSYGRHSLEACGQSSSEIFSKPLVTHRHEIGRS